MRTRGDGMLAAVWGFGTWGLASLGAQAVNPPLSSLSVLLSFPVEGGDTGRILSLKLP